MKLSTSNHARMVLCLVSAALGGLGCGAGAGDTDTGERVGAAAEAFTSGYYQRIWHGPTRYETTLPTSAWTCFLSGVGGHVFSQVGAPILEPGPAHVGAVVSAQSTWQQYNGNGDNDSDVGGSIVCVPAPATIGIQHWMSWSNGGAAVKLASASDPHLICGLTAIGDSQNYTRDNLWSVNGNGLGYGDSAYVFQYKGDWYLGGSGNAEAWATCVDHPTATYGTWNEYGDTTVNLQQANIDTTQCFLYGVGGSFDPDPADPTNGVSVNYSFSNFEWSATFDDGKALGVFCVD